MSTRKRRNVLTQDTPPKSDLSPARNNRTSTTTAAKHTPPPFLSRVRFDTFIYILSGLALAFIGIHAWRLFQWNAVSKDWWASTLGRPERGGAGDRGGEGVEERIKGLADALGVPSRELASAIADAVRRHVPPASLSSISAAAAAEATQSGGAVEVLVGEPGAGPGDRLGALAGLDDPVVML